MASAVDSSSTSASSSISVGIGFVVGVLAVRALVALPLLLIGEAGLGHDNSTHRGSTSGSAAGGVWPRTGTGSGGGSVGGGVVVAVTGVAGASGGCGCGCG